jgi:hypothetical protein
VLFAGGAQAMKAFGDDPGQRCTCMQRPQGVEHDRTGAIAATDNAIAFSYEDSAL